jgi:SAM-dependent methyltransferase
MMIDRTVSVVPAPKRGVTTFASWVAESCTSTSVILNIGAGHNKSDRLVAIMRQQPYVVGVDPDETIWKNPDLDERYQQTMEQFAADHLGRFDAAFAVYVLEHVEHPDAFIGACASVLKPGAPLFAVTLNKWQYFGLITWAATRLGISDRLLLRIKGPEVVARYHFPTQYRLNSIRSVTQTLDRAGFQSVEFRCFDQPKRYAWYLAEPVRGFAHGYTRVAYALGRPSLMGHLSFRAVR